MKFKLNKSYTSGLLGYNDLHAGGIFFSIIYVNRLSFFDNGKVTMTRKVINAFRPMDPQDVTLIENYKAEGSFFENDRGYLVCRFDEISIELTGLPVDAASEMLSFLVNNHRLGTSWSEIYQVDKSNVN